MVRRPLQNRGTEAALPAHLPDRGPAPLRVALGVLVVVGLLSFWLSWFLWHRLDARFPVLPPLDDKPVSVREALRKADRLARAAPAGPDGAGTLGKTYHANLFYAEAAQCYALARELEPRNPRWPYLLAVLQQTVGAVGDTRPLLEQTVQLAPEYVPAWLKLADVYLKQAMSDAAERAYLQCLQRVPGDPYARLGLARVALAREQWGEAERQLVQLLEQNPRFGAGYRLIATLHERAGRRADADAAHARAERCTRYRTAPDPWVDELDALCADPGQLLIRADICKNGQDFDRALSLLERAVTVAPGDALAHAVYGEALRGLGETEKAREHLLRALALDSSLEKAWSQLGRIYGSEGRLDDAQQAFDKALALCPESPNVHYGLGMVALDRGDHAAAAVHFQRAAALSDFRYDDAVEQAFRTIARQGGLAAAESFLRPVLQLRPGCERFWSVLAKTCAAHGQSDRAQQILREGLAAAPYDPTLSTELAWLLATSPQAGSETVREALALAQQGCDFSEPKDEPRALDVLAAAHARAGDYAHALETIDRAIALARERNLSAQADEFAQHRRSFLAGQPVTSS